MSASGRGAVSAPGRVSARRHGCQAGAGQCGGTWRRDAVHGNSQGGDQMGGQVGSGGTVPDDDHAAGQGRGDQRPHRRSSPQLPHQSRDGAGEHGRGDPWFRSRVPSSARRAATTRPSSSTATSLSWAPMSASSSVPAPMAPARTVDEEQPRGREHGGEHATDRILVCRGGQYRTAGDDQRSRRHLRAVIAQQPRQLGDAGGAVHNPTAPHHRRPRPATDGSAQHARAPSQIRSWALPRSTAIGLGSASPSGGWRGNRRRQPRRCPMRDRK